MADTLIYFRKGEKDAVYGTLSASKGTLTITETPTCTLYDRDGEIVTDFNGIDVTDYDTGAAATVEAWYVFDTANLAVGWYTLVFAIQATGSTDGITRTEEPSVAIQVKGVTE